MIDIDEIEREISLLQARDTSYATIERLAWLYVVSDHLTPKLGEKTVATDSSSDFLAACQKKPLSPLLEAINEHVQALRVVYPRAYDALLDKINAL